MGLASSHALGLALGRPDKRVIVLDGDGSLLMNLGTLVTTAEAAPKNLYHFVMENGTYEANGGHPIPGRGAVSFAGLARSAGHKSVYEFADLKVFEQQVGAILAEPGPAFVGLKIVSSGEQERDYSRIHGPHVRKAFRDALVAG
jgi:phosphonopyruvate decarboxylase